MRRPSFAITDATHPPFEISFAAGEDLERLNEVEKLPGLEKKRRVRRLPARGLCTRERLIDQHATTPQRADDRREQRPVQVVHDDDQIEGAGLEVCARRSPDR